MSLFFNTLKRSEAATEDFLVALDNLRETHGEIVDLAQETLRGFDTLTKLIETQEVVSSESFNDEAVVNILNHGKALESLCGKTLAEINKVTALKALEDAAQTQAESFFDKIRAFFHRIMEWLKNLFSRIDPAIQKINTATSINADSEEKHKLVKYDAASIYGVVTKKINEKLKTLIDALEASNIEDRLEADYAKAVQDMKEIAEAYPQIVGYVDGEGLGYRPEAVIFGTLKEAGYDTLGKAQLAAGVYNDERDTWYLDADKWSERFVAKLKAWLVTREEKAAKERMPEGDFKEGYMESIGQVKQVFSSISSFLQLQNKLKADIAATVLALARECSEAPAQQPAA